MLSTEKGSFESLPVELRERVYRHCDPHDLRRLRRANQALSKELGELLFRHLGWSRVIQRLHWGDDPIARRALSRCLRFTKKISLHIQIDEYRGQLDIKGGMEDLDILPADVDLDVTLIFRTAWEDDLTRDYLETFFRTIFAKLTIQNRVIALHVQARPRDPSLGAKFVSACLLAIDIQSLQHFSWLGSRDVAEGYGAVFGNAVAALSEDGDLENEGIMAARGVLERLGQAIHLRKLAIESDHWLAKLPLRSLAKVHRLMIRDLYLPIIGTDSTQLDWPLGTVADMLRVCPEVRILQIEFEGVGQLLPGQLARINSQLLQSESLRCLVIQSTDIPVLGMSIRGLPITRLMVDVCAQPDVLWLVNKLETDTAYLRDLRQLIFWRTTAPGWWMEDWLEHLKELDSPPHAARGMTISTRPMLTIVDPDQVSKPEPVLEGWGSSVFSGSQSAWDE